MEPTEPTELTNHDKDSTPCPTKYMDAANVLTQPTKTTGCTNISKGGVHSSPKSSPPKTLLPIAGRKDIVSKTTEKAGNDKASKTSGRKGNDLVSKMTEKIKRKGDSDARHPRQTNSRAQVVLPPLSIADTTSGATGTTISPAAAGAAAGGASLPFSPVPRRLHPGFSRRGSPDNADAASAQPGSDKSARMTGGQAGTSAAPSLSPSPSNEADSGRSTGKAGSPAAGQPAAYSITDTVQNIPESPKSSSAAQANESKNDHPPRPASNEEQELQQQSQEQQQQVPRQGILVVQGQREYYGNAFLGEHASSHGQSGVISNSYLDFSHHSHHSMHSLHDGQGGLGGLGGTGITHFSSHGINLHQPMTPNTHSYLHSHQHSFQSHHHHHHHHNMIMIRRSTSYDALSHVKISAVPSMQRFPHARPFTQLGDSLEGLPKHAWMFPYIVACCPPALLTHLLNLPPLLAFLDAVPSRNVTPRSVIQQQLQQQQQQQLQMKQQRYIQLLQLGFSTPQSEHSPPS